MNIEPILRRLRNNETIVDIAKDLNISRNTIYYHLKKNKAKRPALLNEDFFENIDSENKAYWLGFIMADGCVGIRYKKYRLDIGLQPSDYKHLHKFHNDVESSLPVRVYDYKSTSNHTNNKICEDLIRHGCVPNKSLILQYPDISPDLDRHFIRGYFDGDGSIYQNKKTKQWKISFLGTSHVLSNIKERISTKANPRPAKNIYCLCLHGNNQVKRVLHYLYDNASIYLDRKFQQYERCCNAI